MGEGAGDDPGGRTRRMFVGGGFVVLGLWWVLAAISDVLRDLHLAGSVAAVDVPSVVRPTVSPADAARRLRVWEDWDDSLALSGQTLHSNRVVLSWLAVHIAFVVVVGWLLRRWAAHRLAALPRLEGAMADITRTGPSSVQLAGRVGATRPLLAAAERLAVAFISLAVVGDVALAIPVITGRGVSGWLNVTYVLTIGTWLAFVAAFVPILVSYLVAAGVRRQGRDDGGRLPPAPIKGVVQTALDLRAQVLGVGLVVVALLFLPGNVRPQVDDLIRGWHSDAGEALVAVVAAVALSAMSWWTGMRALWRVGARGPVVAPTLLGRGGVRLAVASVAAIAAAAGAFALQAIVGRWQSLAVVAAGLALWVAASMLERVRAILPVRPEYERRPGVVRVLAFLPVFALAVAWFRAEASQIVGDFTTWRSVFLPIVAVAVYGTWRVTSRAPARGAPRDPDGSHVHGRLGPRAAGERIVRPETLVPVALAMIAGGLIAWAAIDLDVSWTLGAIGLVVIAGLLVLGVVGALTTALFAPPRGAWALLRVTRFPVVLSLLGVAMVMSLLIDDPGFHKVRLLEPAGGTATSASGDGYGAPSAVRPARTLATAYEDWERTRAGADPMAWRPLVVFASAGGGGRAAYWTMLALDCLFGAHPVLAAEPACARPTGAPVPALGDVFAASGISGGSVGLAMFTAARGDVDPDAVFAEGFVDPVIANLLAIDVPNGLVHAPRWRDRAARLEQAYEAKVPQLADPYLDRTPDASGAWDPLLVLNSAAVEDGCRVVVSPVSFAAPTRTDPPTPSTLSGSCRSLVRQRLAVPPAADDLDTAPVDEAPEPWSSTRDLAQIVCADQDLRTSTAALLSARFPYVSPSGAVEFCGDIGRFTFLVDGGTVDSSAARPAALLVEEVVRLARASNDRRAPGSPCIQPIVVQLDNGYEDIVASGGARRPSELLAPIEGGVAGITNNADIARQELAVLGTQLHERAGCAAAPDLPTYLQVYPQSHPGTEAPLGWSLSGDSRTDMRDQLSSPPNQCSLLALRYWMTGSAAGGVCTTGTLASPGPDRSPVAASGFPVCLRLADGSIVAAGTNAYGVFVRVDGGADGTVSAPPEPVRAAGGSDCVAVTGLAPPTYGDDGHAAFALGYALSTDEARSETKASWNVVILVVAGALVAAFVVLAGAGALGSIGRRSVVAGRAGTGGPPSADAGEAAQREAADLAERGTRDVVDEHEPARRAERGQRRLDGDP